MPVGIPFLVLLRLSKTSRTRQAYKTGESYRGPVKSASLHQCHPVNYMCNTSYHCMTQLSQHPCANVSQSPLQECKYFFHSRSHYLCQIKTNGDKQIYEPIDILTRDPNSPWNVKHVLCQFHLVTQKFDVSVLKKADPRCNYISGEELDYSLGQCPR
jgi:hypothetical protein